MIVTRVHFHRPGENWISRQIAAHDSPHRYSHVSIEIAGMRYDAHAQGGVKFRPLEEGTDVLEVIIPAENFEALRRMAEREACKGYDFSGVGRFKLGIMREDPERWFCSELVLALLQEAGLYNGLAAYIYSPNALWNLISAGLTLEGR